MSVTLSDEQNKLIQTIAKTEGLTSYNIEANSGSTKGDNYLGIITAVKVQDANSSKVINLVLKSAQQNELFRKIFPIRQTYLNEIFMYQNVFPEFQKYQIEQGVQERFSEFAKCYGTSDLDNHECLALEDLREIGYKLWDRHVPMNAEHVAIVFEEYAKFHALSFAMKNQQPERFLNIKKNLNNDSNKNIDKSAFFIKPLYDVGLNVVKDDERVYNILKKYADEKAKDFMAELGNKENKYSVINHGDCWCNNMLFKYEDIENPEHPTKVCLIDWQISKMGSPVLDLSYFFYVSSPKELFNDYKTFLKIYHDKLLETLKSLNCDLAEIFPFNELENHWKKYSKFGLHLSLFCMKIMLSDSDEVPDITAEMKNSGKTFLEALSFESVHKEEIDKRIRDIITFLVDNDFL